MKIKEKDFIELDFIARIKDTNQIFDLTEKEVAKKENIYNEKIGYNSLIVCVGQGFVLPGLDKELVGKEPGKSYKIDLSPEEAFGRKNPKLFQLVNTNIFKKQKINPMPGLQVNLDNSIGVIKSVSGGRTLVDFNHPLAGRDLVYEIKINKIIKDDKIKIKSILNLILRQDIKFKLKENNLVIDFELPKELQEPLKKKIKELIPNIKKITFKAK